MVYHFDNHTSYHDIYLHSISLARDHIIQIVLEGRTECCCGYNKEQTSNIVSECFVSLLDTYCKSLIKIIIKKNQEYCHGKFH